MKTKLSPETNLVSVLFCTVFMQNFHLNDVGNAKIAV